MSVQVADGDLCLETVRDTSLIESEIIAVAGSSLALVPSLITLAQEGASLKFGG